MPVRKTVPRGISINPDNYAHYEEGLEIWRSKNSHAPLTLPGFIDMAVRDFIKKLG